MRIVYETPEVQVLEMEAQEVIAQSPGTEGSRSGYENGGVWPN